MFKRTWIITGEVTRDDIEWVLRSRLDFTRGEQHYIDFVHIGTNRPMKVPSKLDPSTIITTNEKEEMWLKLYFADRAILLAEEVNLHKYEV